MKYCFKVCPRGTDRLFECTQPIYITCEFATKITKPSFPYISIFNDFSKTKGARCGSSIARQSRVVYLTNYLMLLNKFIYVILSKRSLDILIIFSYMENSKFTESVFQDMKYNLQGRLSRFFNFNT